ncbi:MAG: hypothetical protein ACTJG9_15010, partial [Alcaligenes aquatilis]
RRPNSRREYSRRDKKFKALALRDSPGRLDEALFSVAGAVSPERFSTFLPARVGRAESAAMRSL